MSESLPDEEFALDSVKQQDAQEQQDGKKDRFGSYDKKGLGKEDVKKIGKDHISLRDVVKESNQIKEQAENLLSIAEKDEKITKDEAQKLRRDLNTNTGKTPRQKILTDIQEKITSVGNTKEDPKVELPKEHPEVQKAYATYDALVKSHVVELGQKQVDEYTKWIREQHPTLENLKEQTAKFFSVELPPRQETFRHLKGLLGKYGIGEPLSIKFLADEGLTERKAYIKQIEDFEQFFDKKGDLKRKLYDGHSEKALIKEICLAGSPEKQADVKKQAEALEDEEATAYSIAESAVGKDSWSRKSMLENLGHYKKFATIQQRRENLKQWEGYIETERKLTDKLKEVFDKAPTNKEGFKLAFATFKDMNYDEKAEFIQRTENERKKETSNESHNKELTIKAFKHKCQIAREQKIISKSTEGNYANWIDKNSKGKTYKEVKVFYDILTSDTPMEQAKNLKAYEEKRKKFKEELKRLRDISPDLDEEKLKKWQTDYDKEGWKAREKKHKELTHEITRRQNKRAGIPDENADDNRENKESKEKSPAMKNKETALKAIKNLEENGLLAEALLLAKELLENNPEDEQANTLFRNLMKRVNGNREHKSLNEEDIFNRFAKVADLVFSGDQMISEEGKRLQTQDTAVRLMEESIQKHHGMKDAKKRNTKEIGEKLTGSTELKDTAMDYSAKSEDDKVIDDQSLKGKDAVVINMETARTRLEETSLRRNVQKEQAKNKEGHGGSSVIEFKRRKGEKRTLDHREARSLHVKDELALAEQMARKMLEITNPGEQPSAEIFEIAINAALARIRQKEKAKLEHMDGDAN